MRLLLDRDDSAQVQLELAHVAVERDAPVHVAVAAASVVESIFDLLDLKHYLQLLDFFQML